MNMKVFLRVFLAIWASSAVAQDTTPAATNAPAGASATGGTNEDLTPKTPGDDFTNSAGMEMIKTGGYWVGKFEVTQKQFQKVAGLNPSAFVGEERPVDSVSWNDAMDFCQKLSEKDVKDKKLPDGYYYTLPTEDEWETYTGDASLDDAVTSINASAPRDGTAQVGSLRPNALGLYDTRGNVMEFCLGDTDKPYRVLRGGSWADNLDINLRKEFRCYCTPDDRKNTYGFRCLLKAK
jgi:formylglycine-generating enzyme required for sulfatase activity